VFKVATANLSAISDAELDIRLQALSVDLAIAGERIEPGPAARKRLRQVFRGVVLTVAGILFAAQTGGLTLLLCVAGVAGMIDVLEEDAAAVKLQFRLSSDLERYNGAYESIAIEKANRAW